MAKPGKTDLKQLMDLDDIYDDIFDSKNRGKGSHSMDSMPPDASNQSFQQKMTNENMERQKQNKTFQGKIRSSVNMRQAANGGLPMDMDMQPFSEIHTSPLGGSLMQGGMSGQHLQRNSGSIYPSDPRMHYPVEETNPSNEDMRYVNHAQNYKYGPKAYSLDKNHKHNRSYNSYDSLESFSDHKKLNCIDVAHHIKSCPICSKFYDNDKTMYIVAIIILVIICIILMKKVLENYEK